MMRGCYDEVVMGRMGVVLLVWLVFYLVGGTLGNERDCVDILKKIEGERRTLFHRASDLYFVSKRRVPNGPDPIHNRREWNSRDPPTRA